MKKYQFKKSEYDFDYILEKNGFAIKEHEEYVVFSKKVDLDNDLLPNFDSVKANIEIARMKILDDSFRCDLFSPYVINFRFSAFPLYANRIVSWNTFPGNSPEILQNMIKIAEAEAKICAYNFMQTDIQIKQALNNKN
jgi:hypothetical protein